MISDVSSCARGLWLQELAHEGLEGAVYSLFEEHHHQHWVTIAGCSDIYDTRKQMGK
jgi:hypothetical protein